MLGKAPCSSPSETGTFSSSSFGPKFTTFGPNEFRGTSVLFSPRYRELDRRPVLLQLHQHDGKGYDFEQPHPDVARSGRDGDVDASPDLVAGRPVLRAPEVAPPDGPVPARARHHERLHQHGVRQPAVPEPPRRRGPRHRRLRRATDQELGPPHEDDPRPHDRRERRDRGALSGATTARDGRASRSTTASSSTCTSGTTARSSSPAWVTEVYLTGRNVWDGIKKKFLRKWFWQRRDWSEEADVRFVEVEFKQNEEPVWQIDNARSVRHDDGFCHFAWIQNLPTEEIDGLPDYDGLYENLRHARHPPQRDHEGGDPQPRPDARPEDGPGHLGDDGDRRRDRTTRSRLARRAGPSTSS